MAIENGYITLAQLKAVLRDQQPTYDLAYERAIEAASRQIDTYCNTRFWQSTTPTLRLFKPDNRVTLHTGEFATTTGLIVRTDDDDDGVFENTWAATDYQVEPLTPMDGKPYNRIVALRARYWPVPYWEHARYRAYYTDPDALLSQRARVEVTATWGWAAIPSQVMQACQILAIDLFKSKDLTGSAVGVSELSTGQFGGLRFDGFSIPRFNPIAEQLLSGFRVPVLA